MRGVIPEGCRFLARKIVWSGIAGGMVLFGAETALSAPVTVPPVGGQILQQNAPNINALPPLGGPSLIIPPSGPLRSASRVRIPVKKIVIDGNRLFSSEQLHRLVSAGEGHALTLSQVDALAEKISLFYRRHGYPLDRAIVPPQTVRGGVLHFRVIEARYGKVTLHNQSRVTNDVLDRTLSSLSSGEAVAQDPLDRTLLFLSDIPGVNVNSVLSPGSVAGTSDLSVTATPTPIVTGNASIDDYGNPYTGAVRLSGGVAVNSPFHRGDLLMVNAVSSGNGFTYARLGYEVLLNGWGTRLGGAYSAMTYRLGGGYSFIPYESGSALAALGANGNSQIWSLYMTQPIVRSRTTNLSARLGWDHYFLSDTFSGISGAANNRGLDLFTMSLSGNSRDTLGGGGISQGALAYTPILISPDPGSVNPSNPYGASTEGFRSRWTLSASRLQRLWSDRDFLNAQVTGQLATGALDPSQQMIMGGPDTVRSYMEGALFGDEGYEATVEWQHNFAVSLPGLFQGKVFWDSGGVATYTTPTHFVNLTGPGVGGNWTSPAKEWAGNLELGFPVGPLPSQISYASPVQVWGQIQKTF